MRCLCIRARYTHDRSCTSMRGEVSEYHRRFSVSWNAGMCSLDCLVRAVALSALFPIHRGVLFGALTHNTSFYLGGGAYVIVPGETYAAAGPACLRISSSRPFTSRSFCMRTQQQQQSELIQSSPKLPSRRYNFLTLVRSIAAKIPEHDFS
jgi:hypothetical protein